MRWRSSDIKAPSRKSRNLLKVCDGKWCPNPIGDQPKARLINYRACYLLLLWSPGSKFWVGVGSVQVVERMSHNHNANSNFSCVVVVGVLISMAGGKGFVSHLSVEA